MAANCDWQDTTWFFARGQHGAALRERGLHLKTPAAGRAIDLVVANQVSDLELGKGDIVVLAMKTQDVAMALGQLGPCRALDGINDCLCPEGLESEQLALRYFVGREKCAWH